MESLSRNTSPHNQKMFKFSFEPNDYRLLQSFGERREVSSNEDEDYITTLSFDGTGDFLAVGDRAGRLIFFKYVATSPYDNFEEDNVVQDKQHNLKYKRISSRDFSPGGNNQNNPIEYEYLFDFQSHLKEFDFMKSEEIDQKINFVKWLHHNGSQMNLVTSNSKTIKLWRITEKMTRRKKNSDENGMLSSYPKVILDYETTYKHTLKQEFFKLHKYGLNSISLTRNDEFMLTSDDLKVYLWSLNDCNKPYNVINKTPIDMDDLSEVITCSVLSRKNDNIFMFGTSKGSVNMADLRISGVCDKNCSEYKSKKLSAKEKTFFSDILGSISNCEFSPEEDLIIAREFLGIKTWDIRNTKEPLETLPIYEEVKNHLCQLYENEGIFDKFKVSINKKRKTILTGTYNDSFHLINLNNGDNHQFRIMNNDEVTVQKLVNGKPAEHMEKSKEIMEKSKEKKENGNSISPKKTQINLNNKIIQVEYHPKKNCFALSCLNCLYVFGVET